MKKLYILLLSSIFLVSCTKDPVFEPVTETADIYTYIDNIGYSYADVYCQVVSNGNISSIQFEISKYQDMKRADQIIMSKAESFPKESDFSKSEDVYCVNLNNLDDNTTYYGRIQVETQIGGKYQNSNITFTTRTISSSAVTTKDATDVSFTYATLHGEVVSASDLRISETGFYYSQNSQMTNATSVKGNQYYGSFKQTINNLESGKTYYFQAYAVINGDTYLGKTLSFSTNAYTKPEVKTGAFTDITYNSVKCKMTVLNGGNTAVKEWGIQYSLNSDFINAKKVLYTSSPQIGIETQFSIKNLEGGGFYYYRAFATNTAGTAYGISIFFSADDAPDVEIKTLPVYSTSYTYAYAKISYHTYGQNVTEYGVIYDSWTRYPSLEYDDNHPRVTVNVSDWAGYEKSASTTIRIPNLEEGASYQYRAYIKYLDTWGGEFIEYGENIEDFDTKFH